MGGLDEAVVEAAAGAEAGAEAKAEAKGEGVVGCWDSCGCVAGVVLSEGDVRSESMSVVFSVAGGGGEGCLISCVVLVGLLLVFVDVLVLDLGLALVLALASASASASARILAIPSRDITGTSAGGSSPLPFASSTSRSCSNIR